MPRTYIKKALRQKSKSKHDTTSPRASTAFHQVPLQVDSQRAENVSEACNIKSLDALYPNPSTTNEDKVERMRALHSKWLYEDTEEIVEDAELAARQRQRCKAIGQVVFGFVLHDAQIEAIWTLFYERRDLLLMAKTGFGKSLIFQLLPFMMMPQTGVVLTLMPLKLLQAEQSEMINHLPHGKAIVLNGENNQKHVQDDIARGNYTHVFTSPEIALSKKFKKHVLDRNEFTDRLCLLAIDKIHLVDEWGKLHCGLKKLEIAGVEASLSSFSWSWRCWMSFSTTNFV